MHDESTDAFQRFAEIYDRVMANVPYERWYAFIEAIWEKHRTRPRRVLELACGTGNMTLLLARRGYEMVALDSSLSMLEKARGKAARQGLKVLFIHADMRDFRLDVPVDAVICVFDSINYLTTAEDLLSAFRSVNKSLKSSGLFVFDMNTEHRLATIPEGVSIMEDEDYVLIWHDMPEPGTSSWKVKLTGFLKSGRLWERFEEYHVEKAFPCNRVAELLREAGFAVEGVYDTLSFEPAHVRTARAYFVARKSG